MHAKDPWFYFRYDLSWAAGLVCLNLVLGLAGWGGLQLSVGAALLVLPLALYLMVLAHVVVHNTAHQNLPARVNAVVGEVLGAVVLTRFASWEILHRRHHQYPDDKDRDPHPVCAGFVRFLLCKMLGNLEQNLHQQYLERHGDCQAHRNREVIRSVLSFGTMLLLLFTWHALLGSVAFFIVFLPSAALALLVVAHFNWITHGGSGPSGHFGPVDIDEGIYWYLNRILFGLYMHASHHADPSHFDPLRAGLTRRKASG